MSRIPLFSTSLLALFCAAGSVKAHTTLLTPNGGEVLRVGTKVTIKWQTDIWHQQKGWNLWYSTTGAAGPWITIKIGMPITQFSLVWTVPDTVSSKVRFRIRMDNYGTSYEDISDSDTRIIPSLSADKTQLSLTTGGTQTLTLDADTQNAYRSYWVVGSVTGTNPGVAIGGITIPVTFDAYTDFTVAAPNTALLSMSLSTLDAQGGGKATFNVPTGLSASLVGLRVYHAFFTFTRASFNMASNPVSVMIVK